MASNPCNMKFVIASVKLQKDQIDNEIEQLCADAKYMEGHARSTIEEKIYELETQRAELLWDLDAIKACDRETNSYLVEEDRKSGFTHVYCDKNVFKFFKTCSNVELKTTKRPMKGYKDDGYGFVEVTTRTVITLEPKS